MTGSKSAAIMTIHRAIVCGVRSTLIMNSVML